MIGDSLCMALCISIHQVGTLSQYLVGASLAQKSPILLAGFSGINIVSSG